MDINDVLVLLMSNGIIMIDSPQTDNLICEEFLHDVGQ